MVALTILLLGLLIMLVAVVVLLVVFGLTSVLVIVIPLIPIMMMVGSGILGLIEMALLAGGKDDKRIAKRDLKYLGATFILSGILARVSIRFLWGI